MVAWQTKMFHDTSLAKLESIDSDRGRGQVGLSIVSPSRLVGIWENYMDEKIDESDLEKELGVGEEIWELDMQCRVNVIIRVFLQFDIITGKILYTLYSATIAK